MKKLAPAALAVALAAGAFAQGVPPSVTSITPTRPTPGVPPSVSSFGFTAFNPPPRMDFTPFHPPPSFGVFSPTFFGASVSFGHNPRVNLRFGHHRRFPIVVLPAFYPIYSPVYEPQPEPEPAAMDMPSGNALDRELWSRAAEREDRALDRVDSRREAAQGDRYGEHYVDSRESRRSAPERRDGSSAPPPAVPEDDGPALILILRDGKRLELGNYAIVGQTIYDLAPRGKKIQLAELDLPATQKANDERGLEFKLPTTH